MPKTMYEIKKDVNSNGEDIFIVNGYEDKKKIVGEFFYMEDLALFFVECFLQEKSPHWNKVQSISLN